MDFSKDWEDPANCRCADRLKPLERRKARQHQRCLAHSLVGTPNYIAPEVLLRIGTAPQHTPLRLPMGGLTHGQRVSSYREKVHGIHASVLFCILYKYLR